MEKPESSLCRGVLISDFGSYTRSTRGRLAVDPTFQFHLRGTNGQETSCSAISFPIDKLPARFYHLVADDFPECNRNQF